jgi:hypothetical protein
MINEGDITNKYTRSVLAIATGKKTYVDMACHLAMSFLLWNSTSEIAFFLVTDCPQFIPQNLKEKIQVIEVDQGSLGQGFSSKLHMDQFTETAFTLFIDADCLVYGNLAPVFDEFKGRQVSAVGYNRSGGKNIGFCNDIEEVIVNTSIKYFPLICGSVYYFEAGNIATNVFDHARSLLKSYYQIGLVGLRGKENEEPLLAISMAKFNQNPISDTGLIKADRMFYEFLDSNVIEGKARLWNNKNIPMPEYSTLKLALPLIVHFNAAFAESFEYESEVIRLKRVFINNQSIKIANAYADLFSVIPGRLIKGAKNLLRPVYNSLFGYRKIKTSKRI